MFYQFLDSMDVHGQYWMFLLLGKALDNGRWSMLTCFINATLSEFGSVTGSLDQCVIIWQDSVKHAYGALVSLSSTHLLGFPVTSKAVHVTHFLSSFSSPNSLIQSLCKFIVCIAFFLEHLLARTLSHNLSTILSQPLEAKENCNVEHRHKMKSQNNAAFLSSRLIIIPVHSF